MTLFAIEFEDGSVGVMKLMREKQHIDDEIGRCAFPSRPMVWREVSDAEAARIRAERPQSVAPVALQGDAPRYVQNFDPSSVTLPELARIVKGALGG